MSKRHGLVVASAFGIFVAMLLTCSGVMAKGHRIPKKINEKEALNLVVRALGNPALRAYLFYDGKGANPVFIGFDGVNPPPARWGSFGFYAVNPWTGDVWALWGCYKMSNAVVRKAQAEIRRRFTRKEMKHYAELRRLKPDCTFEAPPPKRE